MSKNDGVDDMMSTGDTTGELSLPEMPRSVSEWMNSLFARRLILLPIVCPMLAVSDCFWKYVFRWIAASRFTLPPRKYVVEPVPPATDRFVSYDGPLPL